MVHDGGGQRVEADHVGQALIGRVLDDEAVHDVRPRQEPVAELILGVDRNEVVALQELEEKRKKKLLKREDHFGALKLPTSEVM